MRSGTEIRQPEVPWDTAAAEAQTCRRGLGQEPSSTRYGDLVPLFAFRLWTLRHTGANPLDYGGLVGTWRYKASSEANS